MEAPPPGAPFLDSQGPAVPPPAAGTSGDQPGDLSTDGKYELLVNVHFLFCHFYRAFVYIVHLEYVSHAVCWTGQHKAR